MFLVQVQTEFGVKSRGAATADDVLNILDGLDSSATIGVIVQDEDGQAYAREELERIASASRQER